MISESERQLLAELEKQFERVPAHRRVLDRLAQWCAGGSIAVSMTLLTLGLAASILLLPVALALSFFAFLVAFGGGCRLAHAVPLSRIRNAIHYWLPTDETSRG